MSNPDEISDAERRRMIAEAAYYRAERRGFAPGDPVEDWVHAEFEIDRLLRHSDSFRFIDQLDRQLEAASKRIGELRGQVKGLSAAARTEWDRDIASLTELRNGFAAKLAEIREQGGAINQRVKYQTEKIWNELSSALTELARRRD